jgi:hypothetical protein
MTFNICKKKINKYFQFLLLFFIVSVVLFGNSFLAEAGSGFGVTPAYIKNDYLVPGSHLEGTVYLVRGSPDTEMKVEVTIDAPEIENWITIEQGLEFPLPKGMQQFPMKVIIDVPSDAGYGTYKGFIRVRIIPLEKQGGDIAIITGGRIDLDLVVSGEGYSDFKVKGISIPSIGRGMPLVVFVNLQNTGNVKTRPSKIHLDIYDISHKKLLDSFDISQTTWVEAFKEGQIQGSIPIDLEVGEYWANVSVYKDGESLGINKVYFRVLTESELTESSEHEEIDDKKIGLFIFDPLLMGGLGLFLVLVIVLVIIVKKTKKEKDFNFKEEELFPLDRETQTEKKSDKNKKKKIKIEKGSQE